jgi:hypothetical protein
MRRIIDKYPIYLFLLPVFFFLHNYNQLPFFAHFSKTLEPLFILIFLCGASVLVVFFFTKSFRKAAMAGFFFLAVTLYFGLLHDFLKTIFGKNSFTSYKVVLPVVCVLLVMLLVYFFKSELTFQRFAKYLNLLLLVLLFVEIGSLLINVYKYQKDENLIDNNFSISKAYVKSDKPDSTKPDIYFLVFDEYTNNIALDSLWKFDNTPVTNWLKQAGFYVADSSRANYNFTVYSLSASLNMRYVDSHKGNIGNNSSYTLKAVNSLSHNEVFSILKKENYRFYFKAPFNNSFEPFKGFKVLNDLTYKNMYNTMLFYRLKKDVLWNFGISDYFKQTEQEELENPSEDNYERRVKDVFTTWNDIKATTEAENNRRPKFVFGHFLITHEPHLFDTAGNYTSRRDISSFNTYVSQVQFANKVIKDLVLHIKKNNKKNTIIIVEGDHGFRDLPKEQARWQFPNLHTVYFPDSNYKQLYPGISPVNTFRVVLNGYFKQQYPLLKDSSTYVNNIFSNN